MNTLQKLALAVSLSMLTFSVYAAEDALDAAEAKYDTIAMECEKKFSPESYTDENDRTDKIDECIDSKLKEDQANLEDKG